MNIFQKLHLLAITPFVKRRLADPAIFQRFKENPAVFFDSLKNKKYRLYGSIFFPLQRVERPQVCTASVNKKNKELKTYSDSEDITLKIIARMRWDTLCSEFPAANRILYFLLFSTKTLNVCAPILPDLSTASPKQIGALISTYRADPENFKTVFERQPVAISSYPTKIPLTIRANLVNDYLKTHSSKISETALCYELRENFSPADAKLRAIANYAASKEILRYYRPNVIITMNPYSYTNRGTVGAAKDLCIPYAGVEPGVLPGTLQLDFCGHMGESWVARYSSFFNSLPINDSDIETASKYLTVIRDGKISRRPNASVGEIRVLCESLRSQGKKVLLYTGSNDVDSGHFPYNNETAKQFHSPLYKDSVEALNDILQAIKGRDDIHLLVKHHPCMKKSKKYSLSDAPSLTVVDGDAPIQDCLAVCDLQMTILSQSIYEGLVRGVPGIMMGKNHINGAHCVYSLSSKAEIRETINTALEQGFTETMEKNFLHHVARLLKYYLYDSSICGFGRAMKQLPFDIVAIMDGTAPEYLKYEVAAYSEQMRQIERAALALSNVSDAILKSTV